MRALLGVVATAATTTACGSTLWLITPRPEVTHYEITRMAEVSVTSSVPGTTVYVDGAESGVAPRKVAVPYKEMRRQRRQVTWPAIAGSALDLAVGLLFTFVALDEGPPEAALAIGGATVGVLVLDLHLITGRSVVHEGDDVLPMPVEIGVRATGHEDAARRVRVPEITKLHFQLVPGAPPAPPSPTAPTVEPPPAAPAPPR